MNELVKPVAVALLRSRLANTLRKPADVQAIADSWRPPGGFNNQEWQDICGFVIQLRDADKEEIRDGLIETYQLEI